MDSGADRGRGGGRREGSFGIQMRMRGERYRDEIQLTVLSVVIFFCWREL